jgi:hypothetical protein
MKRRSHPATGAPGLWHLVIVLCILSSLSQGQQPSEPIRSKSEIVLHAIVAPSAGLDPESVRLCMDWQTQDGPASVTFPLELKWNVLRSTREIQIVALFQNAPHALEDNQGHSIHAARLQLTADEKKTDIFPFRAEGLTSGLVLATEKIDGIEQQGKKRYQVEIRFHGDAGPVIPNRYCGELRFRTILHQVDN